MRGIENIIAVLRRLVSPGEGEEWFNSLDPEIRLVLKEGTDEERRKALEKIGWENIPADGLSHIHDTRSTLHPQAEITKKGERIIIK